MAEIVSPFQPSSAEFGNGAGPNAAPLSGGSTVVGETAITLRLIRPLTATVWLADADGVLVTARPVAGSGGPGAADMWTHNALPTWSTEPHPHVLAPRGTVSVDGATWLISEYQPGVRFERLLTAAILTPFQAAYAATDILAGLAELHGGGLVHGRMAADSVIVGADGILRLTDLAAAVPADADRREAVRAADVRHARSLMAELARNADRPSARRRPSAARLLTGLLTLSAAADWPTAAAALSRLTALVLDAGGTELAETDVRRQLAALAAAAERVDARTSARLDGPATTAHGSRIPPLPEGSLSDANWRPRRRRWPWVLAVVVVVAIAGAAVVERGPVTSLVDRLLHRTSTHSTTTSGPNAHLPRTVPRPAPAAAGPIRAVTVRRLTPCRPGHSCRFRIAVHLRPARHPRSVHWTIRTVHRCSRVSPSRRAGVMRVPPHSVIAKTTQTLSLPRGRALAAVVMTTHPARAAARPLLLPPHVSHC